jgi:hypothetical protein
MTTPGPDATVAIPEITVKLSPGTITVPTTVTPPAPPPGMTAAESAAAGDRNDFIKRLFAVAVSVGFATTATTTLLWIVTFSLPDRAGARSSALLLASLLLVVQSWEGYLASVRNYPLKDRVRFIFDIILVFEYLLLLHLSVDTNDVTHHKFITAICTIFVTYLVWDYFRIIAFKENYNKINNAAGAIVPFFKGLVTGDTGYKGPSITFWWLLYFLVVYILSDFTGCIQFYSMIAAIVYGLIMYRLDKTYRFGIITKIISLIIPTAVLKGIMYTCLVWNSVCELPWC